MRSSNVIFGRHNNTTANLMQQNPHTILNQAILPIWTGKLPNWRDKIVIASIIRESIIRGAIIKGIILGGLLLMEQSLAVLEGTVIKSIIFWDTVFGGAVHTTIVGGTIKASSWECSKMGGWMKGGTCSARSQSQTYSTVTFVNKPQWWQIDWPTIGTCHSEGRGISSIFITWKLHGGM